MNTIHILEVGLTQQYMQESMTFQIWFLAISDGSSIKYNDEPKA
jgi:hypothetical protein